MVCGCVKTPKPSVEKHKRSQRPLDRVCLTARQDNPLDHLTLQLVVGHRAQTLDGVTSGEKMHTHKIDKPIGRIGLFLELLCLPDQSIGGIMGALRPREKLGERIGLRMSKAFG